MTTYRFIGTGTTDASGVARLTKDPQGQTISGYTGTGSGEIDFVASLDNPIVDGSIVSETYSILDCIFEDNNNSRETSDYSQQGTWTDVTLTKVDNYKFIKKNNTTQATAKAVVNKVLSGDFEILIEAKTEDLVNLTLQSGLNSTTYSTYATVYGYQSQFIGRDWKYYKLRRVGSTVTIQYSTDQTTWTDLSLGQDTIADHDCYFALGFGYSTRNPQSVSFRNLKIYPI